MLIANLKIYVFFTYSMLQFPQIVGEIDCEKVSSFKNIIFGLLLDVAEYRNYAKKVNI